MKAAILVFAVVSTVGLHAQQTRATQWTTIEDSVNTTSNFEGDETTVIKFTEDFTVDDAVCGEVSRGETANGTVRWTASLKDADGIIGTYATQARARKGVEKACRNFTGNEKSVNIPQPL